MAWSWIKSLLGLGKRGFQLVGTDLQGNRYLEKLREGRPPRRMVKQKAEEYLPGSIPPEWDRWLRGSRNDPPTLKEQRVRVQTTATVKMKAKELERKALEESQLNQDRISFTKASSGHASAPSVDPSKQQMDTPTSTGQTFQPASWKPQNNKP